MSLSFDEFEEIVKQAHNKMLARLEVILLINAKKAESRSIGKTFSRFKNDTGNLRKSINGSVTTIDGNLSMVLRAGGILGGADVAYAKFIEFGTKRGIRARLFMGRSFAIQQEELNKDLRPLLREAFQLRTTNG